MPRFRITPSPSAEQESAYSFTWFRAQKYSITDDFQCAIFPDAHNTRRLGGRSVLLPVLHGRIHSCLMASLTSAENGGEGCPLRLAEVDTAALAQPFDKMPAKVVLYNADGNGPVLVHDAGRQVQRAFVDDRWWAG